MSYIYYIRAFPLKCLVKNRTSTPPLFETKLKITGGGRFSSVNYYFRSFYVRLYRVLGSQEGAGPIAGLKNPPFCILKIITEIKGEFILLDIYIVGKHCSAYKNK